MARSLARPILVATLIAGTLDILAAVILSLVYGRAATTTILAVEGAVRFAPARALTSSV